MTSGAAGSHGKAAPIWISGALTIDPAEIEESFVRAAGPGGQHVNKTSTAVQLRFDVRHSPSLPDDVRQRLERLAGRRLTREGVLVLVAQGERSQKRNREEALARLVELVRIAARPPTPRKKTRPPKASKRRRLDDKKKHGALKSLRARPRSDEWRVPDHKRSVAKITRGSPWQTYARRPTASVK